MPTHPALAGAPRDVTFFETESLVFFVYLAEVIILGAGCAALYRWAMGEWQ